MHYTHTDTPIGRLRIRAVDVGLVGVDHVCQQEFVGDDWVADLGVDDPVHPVLRMAVEELRHYFAGELKEFSTPLAPMRSLGTEFQAEVWETLRTIPFGETVRYGDIAQMIGRPKAVRAVGAANGKNPLSVFVPCHRVIGAHGKLTGYAGGLRQKEILLKLEGSDLC